MRAARRHLLARTGRAAEANEAFTVGLTTDEAVRAYFQRQLAELKRSVTRMDSEGTPFEVTKKASDGTR